jgi:hypothetical protein
MQPSLSGGLVAPVGTTSLGLIVSLFLIAALIPTAAASQPVEARYLKASNTQADDRFGSAVAMWGDTLVVGAPGEDGSGGGDGSDDSAPLSGAAYVYVRDGSGSWSQQAYLKASNTGVSDQFGAAVAIHEDTVVIGAIFEDSGTGDPNDNSASAAGAAYVFVRDGSGAWTEQAYLKAGNREAGDRFGSAVAVHGDTIAVGAVGEDSANTNDPGDNASDNAGAVYVFTRSGTAWSQQAYLKADNLDDRDEFGYSVGVAGSWIIAGAPFEDGSATGVGASDDNSAESAGAVYVFEDSGSGNWAQTEYLKASNSGVNHRFGTAVTIAGSTIVVAAPDEGSAATGVNGDPGLGSAIRSGAAYVFEHDAPDGWAQTAYLKAINTGTQDRFGQSVAVSDDLIVIGAHQEDSGSGGRPADNSRQDSGAAYVYRRELDGAWSFDAYHKALRPGTGDVFGHGVAVAGEVIVVAALEEDSAATGIDGDPSDNSAEGAGAVFVFVGVPWVFSDRFGQ